jgi:hypothetical protein
MKFALSLLGALVVAAAIGTPAHADGPWCAFYDGRFGGASNCGFHTYEQCLATISGVGGWCQPNTCMRRRPAGSAVIAPIRIKATKCFRTVRQPDRRAA